MHLDRGILRARVTRQVFAFLSEFNFILQRVYPVDGPVDLFCDLLDVFNNTFPVVVDQLNRLLTVVVKLSLKFIHRIEPDFKIELFE